MFGPTVERYELDLVQQVLPSFDKSAVFHRYFRVLSKVILK